MITFHCSSELRGLRGTKDLGSGRINAYLRNRYTYDDE